MSSAPPDGAHSVESSTPEQAAEQALGTVLFTTAPNLRGNRSQDGVGVLAAAAPRRLAAVRAARGRAHPGPPLVSTPTGICDIEHRPFSCLAYPRGYRYL